MPIDTRDWYRPKEYRDIPRYAPGGSEDSLGQHQSRRKTNILPFLLISISLAVACDLIWGDRVFSGFEETRNHIAGYLEKYGRTPLVSALSVVSQQECQQQASIPANGAQAWFDRRKPLLTEMTGRFEIHNDSLEYLVASFADFGKKTVSVVVYPGRQTEIDLPIVGDWHVDLVFGTVFCRNPDSPFKEGNEVKVAGQFLLSPDRAYVIRANGY